MNLFTKLTQPNGKAPRPLKYFWAFLVSVLLVMSMTLEKENVFMPLINTAIDLLQQQASPTPGR